MKSKMDKNDVVECINVNRLSINCLTKGKRYFIVDAYFDERYGQYFYIIDDNCKRKRYHSDNSQFKLVKDTNEMKEITKEEYLKALKIVNDYKAQTELHYKDVVLQLNSLSKFANVNKDMNLNDTDCSVELYNSLYSFDINKVSDLSELSLSRFSWKKGVGRVRINELKELCFYAGITLKP
jgi:hypothetical protein